MTFFQQNQQMEHVAKSCFRHSESLRAPNVPTFFLERRPGTELQHIVRVGAQKNSAGREKILTINSAPFPFAAS